MPRYDFECEACKKTEERVVLYSQIKEQKCLCGSNMKMLFSPSVAIISDEIPLRYSMALGKPIDGRADWKKQMKAKGFSTDLNPY